MRHFDVAILGAGPAGERAALLCARLKRRALLIEVANVVGGSRIHWGTIPTKTLRESARFVHSLRHADRYGIRVALPEGVSVAHFMYRERVVVQQELDLINRIFDKYRVEVMHGRGTLVDPHTVAVLDALDEERERVTADFVVIAVGSRPTRPLEVPFDGDCVVDSDTILAARRLPQSLIVMGAGVVGTEYASIFGALGVRVTLVDTREDLLPYLDREIAATLIAELRKLGVERIAGQAPVRVERLPGMPPRVRLLTDQGLSLEADMLLYCVGRQGNTDHIGLENLGIVPSSRGLLEVNDHFQTCHPNVYAVGDVIGFPALASTSMEQGRQAIRHAFGVAGPRARMADLPFAIYTIPEVSFLGETEEAVRVRGAAYRVGRGLYSRNPRGMIQNETGGLLKLVFDAESRRLLGVHVVGAAASEIVHIGQAFHAAGATARAIAETIYNYPTYSDLFRHAALEVAEQAPG